MRPASRTAALAAQGLRWTGALSGAGILSVLTLDAAGLIAHPLPYLDAICTLAMSLAGSSSVGAVAVGARHWGAREGATPPTGQPASSPPEAAQ